MFFTADIYGRTIKSETMQGIKLMATKIANGYHNTIDEMIVTMYITNTETRDVVKWTRINRKSPDGRIERGVWKWNTAITNSKVYVIVESYTNDSNGECDTDILAASTDWDKIHTLWREKVEKARATAAEFDYDRTELKIDEGKFSMYEDGHYMENHHDINIETTNLI